MDNQNQVSKPFSFWGLGKIPVDKLKDIPKDQVERVLSLVPIQLKKLIISENCGKAGRSKSEAKKESSAANGILGGRPIETNKIIVKEN